MSTPTPTQPGSASTPKAKPGYNERLFESRGPRSWVHNARFHWVAEKLRVHAPDNLKIIELGCFDGRLLRYVPWQPSRYQGFDAGWDGGLQSAQERYRDHPTCRFIEARTPEALAELENDSFNIGVALETLEHVPPDIVDDYLAELARVIDGWFLVSVPNEKGLVFLSKWTWKRVFYGKHEKHYTTAELANATLGRMEKVSRRGHKGFDHAALARQIERHFDIVKIEGIPFRRSPTWLTYTVGIVARSRRVA